MYIGIVAGFLTLTLAGDLMGRKMLMQSNMMLTVVGLLLTIFCVNLEMTAAGLFMLTFGIQNCFNTCFYFISELMSDEKREKI